MALADSRSLFEIAAFLTDEEVCALVVVAFAEQTCKAVRRKLLGVAAVEIRLLKARSKAAEDCLRLLALGPVPRPLLAADLPVWWLPAAWPTARPPATGLLRIARRRRANKQLQRVDKKLAALDAVAPVQVGGAHQVADYYRDLGGLLPAQTKPRPAAPEPPTEGGERRHMAGYYLCPVKYLRAAGTKLQALRLKFAYD